MTALSKDDRIKAIRDGVAEAFGFDHFLDTNIWANPEIRSQILQAIENGVKKAFVEHLERGDMKIKVIKPGDKVD